MNTQADKDATLQDNVQTDDTASQSVTSGFMDVPSTLFQTDNTKNEEQFDNWLKHKEAMVKEQLKEAEELKKNQMDFFKDMVKGMQDQFTNFLETSESKITSFFSAPSAHSTPIASNMDPYRLPPPLQSKEKKGSQEHETPQRPDVKQRSRPNTSDTVSPPGYRPFEAELRVIEQRESSRQPPSVSEEGSRHGGTNNVVRSGNGSQLFSSMSRSSGADYNSMHPRAKLPTYDGKEEFDVFIVPFERMAERYNWSEQEKIDKVYECLKGKAMWYMCSLPREMLRNFDTIKDGLMNRFGRKDPPTTVRRKLSEIRQKHESNEEFGEEIRRLVTRAYPGVNLSLQDQLAAEAFLKGYKNSKIAYDVLNKKPTTLNEAIELVTFQEHNYKATVGRDQELQRRDKARRVSWYDDNDDSDSEFKTQRVKAPTYVSLDSLDERLKKLELMFNKGHEKRLAEIEKLCSTTVKTRGNCFNCNNSGHFAKECPNRSRSPSPKPPSRSTSPSGKNISCTRIPNQGRALRVPVKINNVDTLAVIDTGADATVVSEEVANKAGIVPDVSKQVRLLNATNNSEMSAFGGVTATIQMGDKLYNWKIFIAPIRDPVLLGIDFMKEIDATIHTGQGNVEIDGKTVIGTITSDNEEPYACSIVKAVNDVVVPAASERIVIGRVLNPAPDKQAVLEVNTLPGGVQVGSCLVNMKGDVPVRLLNLMDHDVTIKRDIVLGKLTEAEEQFSGHTTWNSENKEPSSRKDSSQDYVPDHLKELFTESAINLNDAEKLEVAGLLNEYADIFARSDFDLGKFTAVQHQIDTSDAKPVRQPARRTPLGFMQEEEEHLKKLLDKGIVVPSKSNWASPVVLVRKKDGSVRWCVDYRRLNQLSVKDAYPIPKIDECLDTLSGATLFSTLDLMWGYHQIEVAPDARPKTAFITKYGLFEFTRMPFGLSGAPSTFQRVMELVLQGLQWTSLLIYLDDVIVTGKDFHEHLGRLREVFERFRQHGLKLKAKKCQLFQTQVLFLGHVVSCDGVSTNPEVVMDVVNWPTPRSVKELQAFLGLSNYYRRFINGYAEIASPLYSLTKKGVKFVWGQDQEKAMKRLKQALTGAPVLAYPLSEGTFILDTDASNFSIGAVLSQEVSGIERVVAYASRRLGCSQQRYCVTRRELLAVVAFCHQFKHYLLGRRFILRTDHSSLAWLFRFKSPQGQLARWLEELCQYSFTIQHRAGKSHNNADALSRIQENVCDCYQAGSSVASLPCEGCKHCMKVHEQWARFEEDVDDVVPLATRRVSQEEADKSCDSVVCNWMEGISREEMKEAQKADKDVSIVYHWVEDAVKPSLPEVRNQSAAVRSYFLTLGQFRMLKGVLYYNWIKDDNDRSLRLVVPQTMRREVIKVCHEPAFSAHQGEKKTLDRVRNGFHWYGLSADVTHYVATCRVCGSEKKQSIKLRAPLQSYISGMPLDRLHIDALGPFPESASGNRYILVIVDQFTKWTEAYAVPNISSLVTAKCLVEQFIARFGAPLEIHTDQGSNFQSGLFKEVCSLLEVTQTRTTPYHPASNGQVERFNRTLLQMIRCYVDSGQKHWDEKLPLLLAAYRSTPHSNTGYTPNRLMLGREVHLPQDLIFREQSLVKDPIEPSTYVERLQEGMQEAHREARKFLHASQVRQKKLYDIRSVDRNFSPGDLVYVSKLSRSKGKSPKLQSIWDGPFLVTKQHGPVLYEIRNPTKQMVLHQDRLKSYRSENFPGWVNRLRKDITIDSSGLHPMEEEPATSVDEQQGQDGNVEDDTPTSLRDEGNSGPLRTRSHIAEEKESVQRSLPHVQTRSGRTVKPPKILDM